jgi:hypothetical protein
VSDRDALVRSLWEEGKNDVQIAAAVGVTVSAVFLARKRLGLPTTRPHIDRDRLRELWQQGMTDGAIAKEMHRPVSSVGHVRIGMRLEVHRAHPRTQERLQCKFTRACGSKMTRSLTPPQCEVVREFLSDLLRCANQRRPGEQYNVSKFMTEYTGRSAAS